jgi:hypothetical protein
LFLREPTESTAAVTIEKTKTSEGFKTLMPVYLSTSQGSCNYKVDVSLQTELLEGKRFEKTFRAVLDAGAAPVIVSRGAFPEGVDVRPLSERPLLFDAQRRSIAVLGVIRARVRMGAGEYDVEALVARDLSVDLLLGTQFIDRHVQLINVRRRVVLMDHGDEIPLVQGGKARASRVVVVEHMRIPPMSEAVVSVRSNARGLCLITTMGRRRVSVTNGLHQLEDNSPFLTRVANFSKSAVTLSPGMVIGQAETYLENLVLNVEEAAPNEKDLDWQN